MGQKQKTAYDSELEVFFAIILKLELFHLRNYKKLKI